MLQRLESKCDGATKDGESLNFDSDGRSDDDCKGSGCDTPSYLRDGDKDDSTDQYSDDDDETDTDRDEPPSPPSMRSKGAGGSSGGKGAPLFQVRRVYYTVY